MKFVFRVTCARNFPALISLSLIVSMWSCSGNNGTKDTGIPDLQNVEVVRVDSKTLSRELHLPGELRAYRDVAIFPKVEGFVQEIFVDRGSLAEKGSLLARLTAPELAAKRSEAEAKLKSAQSELVEAKARLASSEATYKRLEIAAATPGVVSGNDLEIAQKKMEADKARMEYVESGESAAQEALRAFRDMEAYLDITAPFSGMITERNVHEGTLVGSGGAAMPMLRLQEIGRLRLVTYIPEAETAGIIPGSEIRFSVPAFPGEIFSGIVRRIAHALDSKTRTMPVELDVNNADGRLAPGMYAEVAWQSTRPAPSLFVPQSAVTVTTGRIFVIRINDARTEYIDVEKGMTMNNAIEIFGKLKSGDMVVARGNDELREGTQVNPVEKQSK